MHCTAAWTAVLAGQDVQHRSKHEHFRATYVLHKDCCCKKRLWNGIPAPFCTGLYTAPILVVLESSASLVVVATDLCSIVHKGTRAEEDFKFFLLHSTHTQTNFCFGKKTLTETRLAYSWESGRAVIEHYCSSIDSLVPAQKSFMSSSKLHSYNV